MVEVMLTVSEIMMGVVGTLLSALLVWIGAAIKAQREDTKELRSETRELRSETAAGFEAQRAETSRGFEAQRAETSKLRSDMDRGFGAQRVVTDGRFERVDGKLDTITDKLGGQGERIARLEGQSGVSDPRADAAEQG